jgi:nucleoside-diphosphate-sugar epimerase
VTVLRVLITGATGFLGSHLARRLVRDGHDVHVLARPSSTLHRLGPERASMTVHVLETESTAVRAAVSSSRPEVVFHLASLFRDQHAPEDVRPLILSNVLFGAELLDAMTAEGVNRLVVAGTSWQHYEDAEYDPACLYAATKQAFRDLLTFWSNTTPLRTVVLELFDTYGAGDERPKVIPLLLTMARDPRRREVAFSEGHQLLDFVHVDDVVEALIQAGGLTGTLPAGATETYTVRSGEAVSLRQLAALVESLAGHPLPIRWGARAERAREVRRPSSRGERLPGWSPRISLRDGIQQLVAALAD